MAYKGEDLELRSPQSGSGQAGPGWSQSGYGGQDSDAPVHTNGARLRPRPQGGRPTPLIVDETLLACCNYAYDIASVNGAREVMLEHLVHALTRIPEAAQILENRGIHVASLRRESAAIIANDIPGAAAPVAAVRASNDFDAVLHLAAANARLKSDRPTSIRDILFVLINYDRDAPGIELLRRYWPTWQQDEAADRVEEARVSVNRTAASIRELRSEIRTPIYDRQATPMADRAEVAPMAMSVSYQTDGRLDAIERGLGMMASEVTKERKMLGDLVAGLHDSVVAQRSDAHNFRGALGDRLGRLEKSLEAVRYDGGGSSANLEAMLATRLQRLEKLQESLLAQRSNMPNFEAAFGDRLTRLEKAIEANRLDASKLPAGISDRLQLVERTVENKLAELSRTWGVLGDRLGRLEKSLETVTGAMPTGLVDRMQAMEKSFETKINEGVRSWSGVGERLTTLERSLSAQRAEVAHIQAAISTELKAIEKAVSAQPAGPANINERFQALERMLEAHRNELASNLPGPIIERLQGIERSVEGRLNAASHVTATQSERLQGLEKALSAMRTEAGEFGKLRDGEILEIRNTLTRFASAQSTLAGAVDQWRLDNTGDLGIISNRLEAIEHASIRPMEMLEAISTRVQSLSQGQSAAQQAKPASPPGGAQRRGFWRWLFGIR